MRDAIIEKLTKILPAPPGDEAATVYALVEIRKYLEREKWQSRYRDLAFFCDWVVHTVLDRRGASNALAVLDARLANLDLTNPAKPRYDQGLHRFIKFDALHDELDRFLKETKLPDSWVLHPAAWYTLVKQYAEVVRDCKLERPEQRCAGRHFQRVVLTDVQDADKDSFTLVWHFTLTDDTSFRLKATINCPPLSSAAWKGDPGPTEMGL